MMHVAVRIFHPRLPAGTDRPLNAWLGAARGHLAERHLGAFQAAGAADVQVVSDPAGDLPFGRRMRDLLPELRGFDGVVLLGSGAVPLATPADHRRFIVAGGTPGAALANNRYSGDIVAIGGLEPLANLPELATDNALPRWLEESAGYAVDDLRHRWRLAIDLDSPLDLLLTRGAIGTGGAPTGAPGGVDLVPVVERLAAVARVAADPRAELVLTGRTSAASLTWLERATACRVRALIEERGLRAGSDAGRTGNTASAPERATTGGGGRHGRAPASVLGALLDREGPSAVGGILARLGDAAVIDTRVLLAHRLGRDESAWPCAEDRFASDLLLPDRIADPWLRALTAAALAAPIPILLGGHTLVGPGLHLLLGRGRV